MQSFLLSWLPLVCQVDYFAYPRFPLQGLHSQTDPMVWFVWLHEGSLLSVSNHKDGRLWFLVWSSHQPHWELLFLVSDQRGVLTRFLVRDPNSTFPSIFVLPLFLCQATFHCLLQRFHQFECCFNDFDFWGTPFYLHVCPECVGCHRVCLLS